jgi:hypothetical protein
VYIFLPHLCVVFPLTILCHATLVVMNSFHLCLSWQIFISPSILKDNFAGYSDLGCQLFCFKAWNTSGHSFLAFRVSPERSAVHSDRLAFVCNLLLLSWSFQVLYSLLGIFNYNVLWRGFSFGNVYLGSKCLVYLNSQFFLGLGNFLLLLHKFSMPLVCVSVPSSISQICKVVFLVAVMIPLLFLFLCCYFV